MAKTTVPGLYIADGAITAAKLSSTLDLSGVTITVATASTGDSDTSVASTAFVQQEIAALVDSSPSALNTLNELAAAIGDDASFSTTVTNSIATKLPLAGGTLTGNLIINTTGSIQIPVGTTAQRPTAAQGQLRFNTTTSKPEIYSGSAWTDVGGGVESVNSATGVVVLTTANIAENTNLYYTDARADARIAAADTDDLSEGSTNLYFTTARANSAFDGRLSGSTGVTVSNGAVSIGQDVATSTSPTFQNLTLSGTDSIKVPSGTTAQRSGSPANGMLRYNSSTNEFEGYADSAWGAIGGDTTSSVDLYTATGNGSTATYDTGKNPQSENNTWVFVGGVYQPKSTYSFSGTQITLSENLPNGEDLEVITGTVSTYNPTDAILGQYNVTTSNTASYNTSLTTENENNVFVFVDGVYQPKSSYTYSGSTLTLDAVPTSGMSLEVLVTRSMNAATVTTGFLADDAVTTAKITDANVTAGKLASSLDLTGKTVTVATASAGDNDTSVASTAFVRQEITSLVDSAPAAMDTLNELAAALGDDANFSTTVNASIAAKLPLAGGTMSGALNMGSQNITNAGSIASSGYIQFTDSGSSNRNILYLDGSDNVVLATGTTTGSRGIDLYTNNNKSLSVAESGDISFYEDTGSTAKFFWDASAEQLGIGTASPAKKLHISSGVNDTPTTFRIENTDATIETNQEVNTIEFYSNDASGSGTGVSGKIAQYAFNPGNQYGLLFSTYNVTESGLQERMRIDATGKVGIGTNNPVMGLHVGDTKGALFGSPTGGSMYVSPSYENTLNGSYGLDEDTADLWINYRGYQDGTSRFRDFRIGNGKQGLVAFFDGSSGNVGIGTANGTNPARKLVVENDASTSDNSSISIISGNQGFAQLLLGDSDADVRGYLAYQNSDDSLQIGGAGTEKMRIESSGSVGIGTNPPTTATHPQLFLGAGSFLLGGATGIGALDIGNNLYYNGGWKYRATGAATLLDFSASGKLVFYTAPSGSADAAASITPRFTVDNSGSFGIGEADPDKLLHLKSSGATGIVIESTTNAQNLDIDFYNNSGSAQGRIRYAEGTGAFSFAPNVSTSDALTIAYGGDVSVEKGNLLLSGASSSINPTLSMSDDSGFSVAGAKLWYKNSDGFSYYDSYWTGGGGHKFRSQLAGTTVNNMVLHRDGDLGFGTLNPASYGDGNIEFKDTRGAQLGMRITSTSTSTELGVDTYGTYIQAVTANRGLRLYTSDSSAADTMALQITPQGLVTTPNTSGFKATGSTAVVDQSSTGSQTILSDKFNSTGGGGGHNVGSDYNVSTGIYTAPVDGRYLFGYSLRWETGDFVMNSYIRTYISINNGNDFKSGHQINGSNEAFSNFMAMSSSVIVNLSAGDTVRLKGGMNGGTGKFYRSESNWYGILLS